MSYQMQDADVESETSFPPSAERVPRHTAGYVNAKIFRQMEITLAHYASRLDEIEERIEELDREWDIERMLEANAATVSLIGVILGATVDRRWFLLPGVVAAFLLQHALQGWCPPLPVFRRFGVRTRAEIDQERYALKALRGDFKAVSADGEQQLDPASRAEAAIQAVLA